jgi:hypothetical protein
MHLDLYPLPNDMGFVSELGTEDAKLKLYIMPHADAVLAMPSFSR